MFSIRHLSKLLYMWETFIVRDCLCVWAIIFNVVCPSQRDGTVLHMLCNQAQGWCRIVINFVDIYIFFSYFLASKSLERCANVARERSNVLTIQKKHNKTKKRNSCGTARAHRPLRSACVCVCGPPRPRPVPPNSVGKRGAALCQLIRSGGPISRPFPRSHQLNIDP